MNKLIIAFLLALFSMATYGQTDSTKTKKRDLSVYASVADHLTHDGIDSLKATLLRAADSSFVDTVHVESYKYDDKLHTYAVASIKEAGYEYKVRVYISIDYFPIRQYGELVLPAGEYEALRIDIGEAEGENFWCILYPMMCYPLEAGAVVSKEDGEKLKSVLDEDDYEKLFVEHDEKAEGEVKVRFKLLELLGF